MCRFFLNRFPVCFNLFVFLFLVTPCIVVAVQFFLKWIPIKKRNLSSLLDVFLLVIYNIRTTWDTEKEKSCFKNIDTELFLVSNITFLTPACTLCVTFCFPLSKKLPKWRDLKVAEVYNFFRVKYLHLK